MDPWQIIDAYFKDHTYPFTKHHIESYRQFIKKYIPNAINTYNPITMIKDENGKKLKIEVFVGGERGENVYLDRPVIVDDEGVPRLLTPQEARLRNLTYQTNLYADIEVRFTTDDSPEPRKLPIFKKISLGAIPIMLHSDMCVLYNQGMQVSRELGECAYDTGGYFIIDGKEKVIISQERVTTNRLLITTLSHEKDPNFSHRGTIRCTGEKGEYALISKSVDIFMVRRPDPLWTSMKNYPHLTEYARDDTIESLRPWYNCILVTVAGISGYIPLFTLFRVLGIESDKMISELILGSLDTPAAQALLTLLDPSMRHAATDGRVIPRKSTTATARSGGDKPVFEYKQAKEVIRPYLSKQDPDSLASDKELSRVLIADFFPNIPLAYNETTGFDNQPMVYLKKAQFLGYIVAEFLKVITGIQRDSDRDSYIFQRIDVSGIKLSELFQTTYNTLRKNCRDELDRQYYYGAYPESKKPEDIINENNIFRFFPESIIGEAFMRAMKGAWGVYTGNEEDRVVQDLNRNSYLGYLSHMRRVKNPLDPSLKVVPPHRLHCQQWGVMCPFETPDGANIGYIKNFAMLTHVTFGSSADTVREILYNIAKHPQTRQRDFIRLLSVPTRLEAYLKPVTPILAASPNLTKVFINGEWFAVTRHPEKLVPFLRLLRRNGYMNPFVNIAWYIINGEVRILTEPGRPTRPLFILNRGRLLATSTENKSWFSLIFGSRAKNLGEESYYKEYIVGDKPFDLPETGEFLDLIRDLEANQAVIEFLDIEEENTCLIAMDRNAPRTEYHTHLEIDPAMIMSPITQHIPFMQHNMGPRNLFSAGQMKQAIGIYSTRFNDRFDPAAYIMHYPQKPLVTTRSALIAGNELMPNGVNAIVAVATYSGFNQEDSLIINKAAIDRGFFQITAYKSIFASEEYDDYDRPIVVFDNRTRLERMGKQVKGGKFANYGLLDDSGFIHPESHIPRGQTAAVVGMVAPVRRVRTASVLEQVRPDEEAEIYNDVSMTTDIHLYGTVDRVEVFNKGKARGCKVRFRKVRRPELGDKGVSRYAQKGVIGMILPPEQMPFTKDGVVPDIIINPHSFPSRMCVAQMIECVFAKLCAMEGQVGDGTVFVPFDHEAMSNELQAKHNFDRRGNEVLYNGATGEMMQADIFIGPTFYLRLKHMVLDKINYRGMGANPEAFEPFNRPAEVGMLSPQDQLTRQPTAGRSRGGGLRIGEMERDVLISYGMSHFAKECMMEKADKYKWAVCRHCGTLTQYKSPECMNCGGQDIAKISTPYAFKLWTQEMQSVGLTMRLSQEPFHDIIEDADEDADSEGEAGEASPVAATPSPSSPTEMEGGEGTMPSPSEFVNSKGVSADFLSKYLPPKEEEEENMPPYSPSDAEELLGADEENYENIGDVELIGSDNEANADEDLIGGAETKTIEISDGAYKLQPGGSFFGGDDDDE